MGKRKIANTVFLQFSFGINGFFLKMYMWCCDMFFWRKDLMVFKCCDDSSVLNCVGCVGRVGWKSCVGRGSWVVGRG